MNVNIVEEGRLTYNSSLVLQYEDFMPGTQSKLPLLSHIDLISKVLTTLLAIYLLAKNVALALYGPKSEPTTNECKIDIDLLKRRLNKRSKNVQTKLNDLKISGDIAVELQNLTQKIEIVKKIGPINEQMKKIKDQIDSRGNIDEVLNSLEEYHKLRALLKKLKEEDSIEKAKYLTLIGSLIGLENLDQRIKIVELVHAINVNKKKIEEINLKTAAYEDLAGEHESLNQDTKKNLQYYQKQISTINAESKELTTKLDYLSKQLSLLEDKHSEILDEDKETKLKIKNLNKKIEKQFPCYY